VCLLLVWRVCDQAFGRYRPLKGAEKWSRDHHENWKVDYITHVEKFTDSKNSILFDLRRKITKLSRRNRFRTVASPGACERLAWPSWIDARPSSIHPIYYLYICCTDYILTRTFLSGLTVLPVQRILLWLIGLFCNHQMNRVNSRNGLWSWWQHYKYYYYYYYYYSLSNIQLTDTHGRRFRGKDGPVTPKIWNGGDTKFDVPQKSLCLLCALMHMICDIMQELPFHPSLRPIVTFILTVTN